MNTPQIRRDRPGVAAYLARGDLAAEFDALLRRWTGPRRPAILVVFDWELLLVGEVNDPQSFPPEDAEPLFHLVHPRAMDRRVMEDEPRMLRQPRLHLLPLVHPHVVQDDVDHLHRLGNLSFELLQERDELRLPLP